MSEFNSLVQEYVTKENPKVHGFIAKGIDSKGHEFYSKVEGWHSLEADSPLLNEDVVLQVGSATKIITAIALLQCVERGQLGLDEPLNNTVLREFEDIQILTDVQGEELTFEPSHTPITARLLLTHTSGLGYRFTNRLLGMRAALKAKQDGPPSWKVEERFNSPLVFEPGTGWLYGCGYDWAGVVVRRLNENIHLGDYMVENIWKPLGLTAPFPCFNIRTHPEYYARAMGGTFRQPDGSLKAHEDWAFQNPEDTDGGSGLSATTNDFMAVLKDMVSLTPKILKPETWDLLFVPQLKADTPAMQQLITLRVAWDTVAGPIDEKYINHGLGGVVCMADVPEIKQPKGVIGWGGASNIIWWACRGKEGVAGFFATQQGPFGNPNVKPLVNAWKERFMDNVL